MQPELYDRLYAHCKALDLPITVFVREAISRALPDDEPPPKESQLLAYARAVTSDSQQSPPQAHCWAALAAPKGSDSLAEP
jgi:hypothetical protein